MSYEGSSPAWLPASNGVCDAVTMADDVGILRGPGLGAANSAALQAFLEPALVATGNVVLQFNSGLYEFDSAAPTTIAGSLPGETTLTIRGCDAGAGHTRINQLAAGGYGFNLLRTSTGLEGVHIENFIFVSGSHGGIHVQTRSLYASVDNCRFFGLNSTSTGVLMGPFMDNVRVTNCSFYACNGPTIVIDQCLTGVVSGIDMSNGTGTIAILKTSNVSISSVSITDMVSSASGSWVPSVQAGCFVFTDGAQVAMAGVEILGSEGNLFSLQRGAMFTASGCNFWGHTGTLIRAVGQELESSRVTMSACNIEGTSTDFAVYTTTEPTGWVFVGNNANVAFTTPPSPALVAANLFANNRNF